MGVGSKKSQAWAPQTGQGKLFLEIFVSENSHDVSNNHLANLMFDFNGEQSVKT